MTKTAVSMAKLFCTGDTFVAAVKADGTVALAGIVDTEEANKEIREWRGIVAISAGRNHIVGLKNDGTVVAAGENTCGQCDVEDWQNIIAVATGDYHTIGLTNKHNVVATEFIHNQYDKFGDEIEYDGQCEVEHWTDIVAIAADSCTSVGIKSNGTVVATELDACVNLFGKTEISHWTDIVQIIPIADRICGLTSNGELKVSGRKLRGSIPSDIVSIAAAGMDLFALTKNREVVCIECDLGTWNQESLKGLKPISIVTSQTTLLALNSDGTIQSCKKEGQYDFFAFEIKKWKLFSDIEHYETEKSDAQNSRKIQDAKAAEMRFAENIGNIAQLELIYQNVSKEISDVECRLTKAYGTLPAINESAIYVRCEYFDNIENFINLGTKQILTFAKNEFKKHHFLHHLSNNWEEPIRLWFTTSYYEFLSNICDVYSDAFEAVISQSEQRMIEKRIELQNQSSSRYGYITNDFLFAAIYELGRAVADTLEEMSEEKQVWNSATEPQNRIHHILSVKWQDDYKTLILPEFKKLYAEMLNKIVQEAASGYGLSLKEFIMWHEKPEVYRECQKLKAKRVEEDKQKIKTDRFQAGIKQMEKEIQEVSLFLANCGLALWGQKRKEKIDAQNKYNKLVAELDATKRCPPVPATPMPFHCYVAAGIVDRANSSVVWRCVYNDFYSRYEVINTNNQNKVVMTLPDEFSMKYGRYRSFDVHINGCIMSYGNIYDFEFVFYET